MSSKFLAGMKNVSALLALTDGLRDLRAGLKEGFELEKEIEALRAARDEEKIKTEEFNSLRHVREKDAEEIRSAAKAEAEEMQRAAAAGISFAMEEAGKKLSDLNQETNRLRLDYDRIVADGARVLETANTEARRIVENANASVEAERGRLRSIEQALEVREARLNQAVKAVGVV